MTEQERKQEGSGRKVKKSYFDVVGLCCSSEVPLIENILKPLEGIKEVSVIVPSRTVIVVHDTTLISQFQIAKALNQARLEANVRVYGDENEKQKQKWPSPYALASGILLALSLFKYVYGPLQYVALAAVAAGLLPILLKALSSLRRLHLDINILVLVAVVGTIAMHDYLEAATIVFLFSIAEWLESRASHKASAAMSSLMNMAPQKATIAETGEIVDADEVQVNTVLAVKAGEVIPIDGIVVDGTCEVDEKTLTGESFPVPKQKDSTVWAGTINLNGYISVKTNALAEDCVVAKMAKLVEEAQNSKTRSQRLIDEFAKFYTPAVVITSTLIAVIPVLFRVHNVKHWLHFALVVLVSACPCALVLSTPVVTFCAYTKAATSGLLIKGGDYLETLAKVKVMAFDKTGTITKGEFMVTNFQSLCDDVDLKTLVYWVSSIESKSSHPLAAAVIDYGKSLSIDPKPEEVTDYENFPGEGICGKIDERYVYIGNRKIAARAESKTVPTLEGGSQGGKTIGYIYSGATPIGVFSLSDACRAGVVEAIGQLKSLGIKTSMLTGDSHAAAMQAQEQLGHTLEQVHAELLPEGKAKIITEFKKEGPTAMVGDGVNDAPALAAADIGISMGISGSALASETGNIILMSNDMRKIPKAIKLARKSRRKVIENIILSIVTKAAILGLAIAGHPLVWAAVLADVGTCLLVILNSMLLLHRREKHRGKCCRSSTQLHVRKSGCHANNGKSSHHHHHHHPHHQHKHDSHQHSKITEGHDQCKSRDEIHEPNLCHHGRRETGNVQPHDGESQSCSRFQDRIMIEADKCTTSTDSHGSCLEHSNSHSTAHFLNRNCDTIFHDGVSPGSPCHFLHSHDIESQACSGSPHMILTRSDKCSSAMDNHDCMEHNSHETLHCHNRSCGQVSHVEASVVSPCHFNLSAEKESQQCSNKHCHLITDFEIPEDHNLRKTIRCNHEIKHQIPGPLSDFKVCGDDHVAGIMEHKHIESASMHAFGNSEEQEKGSCCKSCPDECNECPVVCAHLSSNEIEVGACCEGSSREPIEFPMAHACISLDKRNIGGCCKSYMKECCSKHGRLGVGFGGLSEIITEQV
ncbi:cadmium/zinc-transporting ATPase HMA3 [Neltuma alba]|uniref:cadmium/zinc-transporting ATPase HMA3 n=1 Tax=Neltuma alba TaxID=207710 RepID=UPI0010A3B3F2|nr:cadmium/zinc-transporting ATPase HMA3-like [Prosopis alba]